MKNYPKQFLFAIGSPALPGMKCISIKASAQSVPISKSTVPPDECSVFDIAFKCRLLFTIFLDTVLARL